MDDISRFFYLLNLYRIMQFEPLGGFPPIVRVDDKVVEKTLESRGFATTNIVSISNIMDSKKKENLFIAFGSDDEEAGMAQYFEEPENYTGISYRETKNMKLIPKKKNKN